MPSPADSPADDTLTPRRVPATPAMRACLQAAFRTALIRLATDLGLVLLIAAIALWAGNYSFIAVAVILALLIGTPGILAQTIRVRRSLDAPDILRLLGPIRVVEYRRSGVSAYATVHALELPTGLRLHLDEPVYAALAQVGEHLPDRRPLYRKVLGGRSVAQLPTVVTTYAAAGRVVIEVRTVGGAVLARHPGYADA
ncbi:MAG: hypothetical protein IT306_17235 [Chloroflexi bacterium]|nr:hypothetical protein [Chloroflexota bacterium]